MRGPMILRSRSRRAGDSATRCAVFWPFAHSRGKGFIYANRWHKTPLPLAGGKYHAGVTNCHGVERFCSASANVLPFAHTRLKGAWARGSSGKGWISGERS
jgi:hypothetical protein